MNIRRLSASTPRHQQGIALFVALISMVILSLAGIALVRSVDTANSVAGNIAFRQGSIGPVNQAIEVAIDKLFKAKTIVQTSNDTANSYYALLQPGEKPNGVPLALAGDYAVMTAAYTAAGLPPAVVDPATKMEVRSVIERICTNANPPPWPADHRHVRHASAEGFPGRDRQQARRSRFRRFRIFA